MNKLVAVVFTPNNARVLINPSDLSIYSGQNNVVINPDLSLVKGIDPQFWKKQGSQVVPMNAQEKLEREQVLAKNSFSNIPQVKQVEVVVEKIKEVVKEVPVIKEVIKEVPIEIIKYIDKFIEKVKEVPVEVIKEVEVEKVVFKDKLVEIIKEIEKPVIQFEKVEITRLVHRTPNWMWLTLAAQTAIIVLLLFK